MAKGDLEEKHSVQEETLPVGGDYVVVMPEKRGTLFIEARIRDDVEDGVDVDTVKQHLEDQLSRPDQIFTLFTDLLAIEYDARLLLGHLHERSRMLHSLKVVEYSGPITEIQSHCSNDVNIKVQVFQLYQTQRSIKEHEGLPQADVTPLPHIDFDGQWEELFFENDIKEDLIWMMTNILRFSQASGREPGDTSPLILLYGPPGTGKTTLCQGLAQKISIRLSSAYKRTSLIQIKAAALLSKYYSESAKQVDTIFTRLRQMCEDDPEEFICVLIDEVETIAISREGNAGGESKESLRATNAFLTGLDMTKRYPNIVFLCTSNIVKSLDAAFLDRCGSKYQVEPPPIASQYAILQGRLQKLISRRIVLSHIVLPLYRDAQVDSAVDPELPGSQLLQILEHINSKTSELSEEAISGRSLTQIPEQALLRYLRGEDCDLDMALRLIMRYVQAEYAGFEEEDHQSEETMKEVNGILLSESGCTHPRNLVKGVDLRVGGQKRKVSAVSEEDSAINRALGVIENSLGAMGELLAGLRGRDKRIPSSRDAVKDLA